MSKFVQILCHNNNQIPDFYGTMQEQYLKNIVDTAH